MQLGKLEKVLIRDVWQSESTHFTPWLCQEENIDLLGQALSIDLEVINREVPVGDFRLDVLAKRSGTEEIVVIENQFGMTDNKHLGQLLTYAAGVGSDGSGAKTIVWIAEQFNESHRSALDWLNKTTEPGIGFFAVELELWRIGNSSPAPKFNIISRPNAWQKKVTQQTSAATPHDELYAEFWSSFVENARKQGTKLRFPSPWGRQWLPITIGRAEFIISLVLNKKGASIRCELYMSGPRAKQAFRLLRQDQATLMTRLGSDLKFDELPAKIATRIYQQRPGDVKNKSIWPELHQWLLDRAEKYAEVFTEKVRSLDLGQIATQGDEAE